MNKERILAVAAAIEGHTILDLGFNMGTVRSQSRGDLPDMSGHDCGTVACVAGWTTSVHLKLQRKGMGPDEILDITEDEAEELFLPHGWADNKIGPDQAVRTLRHLAETGVVDWTV